MLGESLPFLLYDTIMIEEKVITILQEGVLKANVAKKIII